MSDITTINLSSRPLELCVKCNAYVPNLKKHTCAVRLNVSSLIPFSAAQEARLREIIRDELQK